MQTYSIPDHYPAWLDKRHRLAGKNREAVEPATAVFELEEQDKDEIESLFGPETHGRSTVTIKRRYDDNLVHDVEVNEEAFATHVVDSIDFPYGTKEDAREATTVAELRDYAETLRDQAEVEEKPDWAKTGDAIDEMIDNILGSSELSEALWNAIDERLPEFFYFDEYSRLPYSVDIKRVLQKPEGALGEGELTARSLLRLGGAESEYLENPDYERRKRELESVANTLTRDMREYWTQNPSLRVQPDITTVAEQDGRGQKSVVDELKIRIWDERHELSLPFDEHSSGFQWFFSFLAAFSEYKLQDKPVVLLLDEPALGLHARAQADFLRYIEQELAPQCQVVYTTHSPFMVPSGNLERVRLVEDRTDENDNEKEGTKISSDVTSTDADTLFPLQGALGYDLAQNLFVASHNLVVEGTSDYTYLTVLSDYLDSLEEDHETLDDRWSIVPVGGADLVPTFVALLGNHLDVTVLVDAHQKGHQKLSNLADRGILASKRILTIGDVLLGRTEADVEDLFTEEDYLMIYNRAFNSDVCIDDLQGTDPVARRIARYRNEPRFDHGRPADIFLRERDELLPKLSDETIQRFERLFVQVNATLTD